MSGDTLITPAIVAMLGQTVDFPGKEVVDTTAIRRYAAGIHDLNPLYFDEQYAEASGCGGIIAPPTFVFDVCNNIFYDAGPDGREKARITIPGLRLARAGNEYEFFEPVRLGDVIDRRRTVVSVFERDSQKMGKIIFVVCEYKYTNQTGRLLGINRETVMFFK
ncbi:MAG: MaoC family dehydratase N-terminal domain-containing protein [Chloroflexi bacterium]|nr:MaoC family dehydratase N-terminal domain-containing protein [Chloroflexota bacterium]